MSYDSSKIPPFVVGTAGHIDHGKTSLVQALTGSNLDVLPEEKERGITISLGFTHKDLPSGRRVAFVDVPGHETLVRTMIAGSAGIDAVLLCVSATEGVMPQTKEHLDILRLMGIQTGLVALTHADLVEEDLLELAVEELRELLSGSFLAEAPIVATSTLTNVGIKEIEDALASLPISPKSKKGFFRLPVDRVFVKKGFGAISTGTALSGDVEEGSELVIFPSMKTFRVRALEVHGETRKRVQAGERCAINLAGADETDLKRGSVLISPDAPLPSPIIDARYSHLENAPRIQDGARVRLLVGTTEVLAIAQNISEDSDFLPGAELWIQLRCESPILVEQGDRFILRRASPLTTLGGGEIIDPWAPRFRKRERSTSQRELASIATGDRLLFLDRAGPAGLLIKEADSRWPEPIPHAIRLGDRILSPGQTEKLSEKVLSLLHESHAKNPLAIGTPKRSLQAGVLMELGPSSFDALISRLDEQERLVSTEGLVRERDWKPKLSSAEERAADDLMLLLDSAKWNPPKPKDLEIACEKPDSLVAYLVSKNMILRIGGMLYSKKSIDTLEKEVQQVLENEGSLSPARFKDMTSLSRKNAIPLLEYFDAAKITKREGDTRVSATSCSQ